MKRKRNQKTRWYSLKVEGEKIWLFREDGPSGKRAKSMTPNDFNICATLSRKTDYQQP